MSRSREVPQRSLEGSSSAVTNSRIRVRPTRRYGTLSPLRYPGGKAALAGFFGDIIHAMQNIQPQYIKPYACGFGSGVALLHHGIVDHRVVNEIHPALPPFWRSLV